MTSYQNIAYVRPEIRRITVIYFPLISYKSQPNSVMFKVKYYFRCETKIFSITVTGARLIIYFLFETRRQISPRIAANQLFFCRGCTEKHVQ